MSRLSEEKIKKAIARGDLIPFEDIFNEYSNKEKEAILKRARFIQTAMKLRQLRRKMRLSQERLAKKMKVKRAFIARIESGKQNVTLETLYRVAEATDKSFDFKFT